MRFADGAESVELFLVRLLVLLRVDTLLLNLSVGTVSPSPRGAESVASESAGSRWAWTTVRDGDDRSFVSVTPCGMARPGEKSEVDACVASAALGEPVTVRAVSCEKVVCVAWCVLGKLAELLRVDVVRESTDDESDDAMDITSLCDSPASLLLSSSLSSKR